MSYYLSFCCSNTYCCNLYHGNKTTQCHCDACSSVSASSGFSTAELTVEPEPDTVRLGASPSASSVPLPNRTSPKPKEQQWKNSLNRASTATTHSSSALEIKNLNISGVTFPKESKLEGRMEVQAEHWKDVPRIWETG